MKHRVLAALLAVALCAPAGWCARQMERETIDVPENEPLELLEVGGMLEGVTSVQGGELITLRVGGSTASGPLSPDCLFWGEGRVRMGKDDFLRRYAMRYVTLELEKNTGTVLSCRVGS